MDTSLNKKQLQETLRQMGIAYPSTASKEDLIERLEQENRNQWMRSANSGKASVGKRVLRKKGERIEPASGEPKQGNGVDPHRPRDIPSDRRPERQVPKQALIRKMEVIDPEPGPDLPGKTGPVIPSEKELERYALRRADGVCDLCETATQEKQARLAPCFFMSPPAGKPLSAKEVVALCPECFNRVEAQHLAKDIKILKRKARRTRIGEVKISRR